MSVTIDGTTDISDVQPGVVKSSDLVQDNGSFMFRNKLINGDNQ